MLDPLDELDAVVDQVGVEIFDLLLRQIDLFEAGDDLVVTEEALLGPLRDEFLKLLDLRQGDINREH